MPAANPRKIAFVFPGQGSQTLGMGWEICKAEPDAQRAFEIVTQACDFDLDKVAWHGPEEALQRTRHTQPALLATSAACFQAFRRYWSEEPLCVAGHSLGEISALWAASALTLPVASRLTATRASLMDESPAGSMAAVLGAEPATIEEVCQACDVVVANYNTSQQVVISGSVTGMECAHAELSRRKAKMLPLAVGGAFHSPLLEEANREFSKLIREATWQDASCPVVQNVDAQPHTQASTLSENLARQMTASVRWRESVHKMLELGTEAFVEVGSGKVLAGLIKKIDKAVPVHSVSDVESMRVTLQALQS